MIGSVAVEEALLVLKIAFLVLLYLFIWRIVRTAARDVRMPQESFVLAPRLGARARRRSGRRSRAARLVVVKSPALEEGDELTLDSAPLLARPRRRATTSPSRATSSPRRSTRASSRARDGVWLEDVGSTNGTYLNGDPPDAREAARRPATSSASARPS